MPRNLVMDGEIVCLDEGGHCQFKICYSDAENHASWFDLLYANGKYLRPEQLIDRKRELRRILRSGIASLIYADHIEGSGIALFEVCAGLGGKRSEVQVRAL